MALPFTLKSILRQKKNYGNSNISSSKNIVLKKKSFKRNQNPSRYHNSITILKFQHQAPKISSLKNLITYLDDMVIHPSRLSILNTKRNHDKNSLKKKEEN